ncbi:hypothetical protein [Marinifilum sp. N1E240]|uniref:hypothetical protein n=1 Tax=Marinifilum sp. N1E240 TaxID=2608082 RepID=UPI00186B9F31|nr:hypothetical protein [Marinifilum sp. N1E240]
MKEGLIKDSYELIIKELQSVVTVFYLFMVGMGMLFKHQKFSEFGINIFQYADVFDFLIAPFQDFIIVLFTFASLTLIYLLYKFDKFLEKKFPKSYSVFSFGLSRKSWHTTYKKITFMLGLMAYLYFAADYYGELSHSSINSKEKYKIHYIDSKTISGNLIGKNNNVIFLWVNQRVKILPITDAIRVMEIVNK